MSGGKVSGGTCPWGKCPGGTYPGLGGGGGVLSCHHVGSRFVSCSLN